MNAALALLTVSLVLVSLTLWFDRRSRRRSQQLRNWPGRCSCGAHALNGRLHVSTYLVRHEQLRCQPAREVIP